jgi:hypothetical protein
MSEFVPLLERPAVRSKLGLRPSSGPRSERPTPRRQSSRERRAFANRRGYGPLHTWFWLAYGVIVTAMLILKVVSGPLWIRLLDIVLLGNIVWGIGGLIRADRQIRDHLKSLPDDAAFVGVVGLRVPGRYREFVTGTGTMTIDAENLSWEPGLIPRGSGSDLSVTIPLTNVATTRFGAAGRSVETFDVIEANGTEHHFKTRGPEAIEYALQQAGIHS